MTARGHPRQTRGANRVAISSVPGLPKKPHIRESLHDRSNGWGLASFRELPCGRLAGREDALAQLGPDMQLYIDFARKAFLQNAVYKTDIALGILSHFLFLFLQVSVWSVLYSVRPSGNPKSRRSSGSSMNVDADSMRRSWRCRL